MDMDDKIKVQAMVDGDLAKKGDQVLERYGLNRTTGINAFYRALVRRNSPAFLFDHKNQLQRTQNSLMPTMQNMLPDVSRGFNMMDPFNMIPGWHKMMDRQNKLMKELSNYDEFKKALKETGKATAEIDSDGNVKINGQSVDKISHKDDDSKDNELVELLVSSNQSGKAVRLLNAVGINYHSDLNVPFDDPFMPFYVDKKDLDKVTSLFNDAGIEFQTK